jgi:hypothetical protein
MTGEILKEKIRRARLSGRSIVTADATVAEIDAQGNLQVLSKGTNEWVCCPGNEDIIGDVPMALDPIVGSWISSRTSQGPRTPRRA